MLAQFFQKYIKLNLEKKGNAYINLLHYILFQIVDSSDTDDDDDDDDDDLFWGGRNGRTHLNAFNMMV